MCNPKPSVLFIGKKFRKFLSMFSCDLSALESVPILLVYSLKRLDGQHQTYF